MWMDTFQSTNSFVKKGSPPILLTSHFTILYNYKQTMATHRPSSLALITAYAAILLPLSLTSGGGVRAFSRPQSHHPNKATIPSCPPPISMPVWSLSCPIPFPTQELSSSSMSILTFVTPVSVSSPKLWAVSLYKTSLTRCSFLGVTNR